MFLLAREVAALLQTVDREVDILFGKTIVVLLMLPVEVEDHEVVPRRAKLAILANKGTIVTIDDAIAEVEAKAIHLGIVEEEAAVEVDAALAVYILILIGQKSHPVTGLAKDGRKESTIVPSPRLPQTMGGEQLLEHVAGQIPRTHHVGEHNQAVFNGQTQLMRRSGKRITIELGMILVVTLAEYQHNRRATIADGIDLQVVHLVF